MIQLILSMLDMYLFFGSQFSVLYLVAYFVIMVGILVYGVKPTYQSLTGIRYKFFKSNEENEGDDSRANTEGDKDRIMADPEKQKDEEEDLHGEAVHSLNNSTFDWDDNERREKDGGKQSLIESRDGWRSSQWTFDGRPGFSIQLGNYSPASKNSAAQKKEEKKTPLIFSGGFHVWNMHHEVTSTVYNLVPAV